MVEGEVSCCWCADGGREHDGNGGNGDDDVLVVVKQNFGYFLPIERYLGYFQVLAVVNKAAVNICVQIFV